MALAGYSAGHSRCRPRRLARRRPARTHAALGHAHLRGRRPRDPRPHRAGQRRPGAPTGPAGEPGLSDAVAGDTHRLRRPVRRRRPGSPDPAAGRPPAAGTHRRGRAGDRRPAGRGAGWHPELRRPPQCRDLRGDHLRRSPRAGRRPAAGCRRPGRGRGLRAYGGISVIPAAAPGPRVRRGQGCDLPLSVLRAALVARRPGPHPPLGRGRADLSVQYGCTVPTPSPA
jgi:hypothetical protein